MSEDKETGKTSDTINAAANLAKAIPVYEDALQPLAQEAGRALGTIGQCVNAALMPLRGMVWGFDQVEDWISQKVVKELDDVEPTKIIPPDPSIAGPTIQSLKFNGHKEELSDMFASLLGTAMNNDRKSEAHPSFVSIIAELTPIEAKIFSALAQKNEMAVAEIRIVSDEGGYKTIQAHFSPDLLAEMGENSAQIVNPEFSSAIENLERHQIIRVNFSTQFIDQTSYDAMKTHIAYKTLEENLPFLEGAKEIVLAKGNISVTSFGQKFAKACLRRHFV